MNTLNNYYENIRALRGTPLGTVSKSLWQDWCERTVIVALMQANTELETLFQKLTATPGIRLYLSGRDIPLHLTIKEATGEVSLDEPDITTLAHMPFPRHITFNRAVLDTKGVLFAASTDLPAELVALRTQADETFTRHGLIPRPATITHVTLARLLTSDSTASEDFLHTLTAELNERWRETPLTLDVERVWLGRAPLPGTQPPVY